MANSVPVKRTDPTLRAAVARLVTRARMIDETEGEPFPQYTIEADDLKAVRAALATEAPPSKTQS